MNETPTGSLQDLHDVVAPAAVGPWPPAPGWYVVLGLALLGLVLLGYRQAQAHYRNRYRRAALKRLDHLRHAGPGPHTGPEIALLLKQTALAAWPRTGVASLSGAQWAEFLASTGASKTEAAALSRAGYLREAEPEVLEALCIGAERWIRHHRGPAT